MNLLERDAELAALAAFIENIKGDGTHRVLVVEGRAGIGKTRLLQSARTLGDSLATTTLTARGSEFELGFTYGIVRQLFEPYLARLSPTERRGLFANAAAAAERHFVTGGDPANELERDSSFATLHGLYWLAVNLATIKPLLLMVDDLQWCDTASLRLFAYMVPRLDGIPLGLVAGLRTGEATPNDLELNQLMSDQVAVVVRPSPLSRESTALMLAAEVDGPVEDSFVAACQSETGGNPLLLRQLIDAISTEQVQPIRTNTPRIAALGASAVERMVLLRLSRLTSEASEVAKAVALLGDAAELDHAAAVAGLSLDRTVQAADELAHADILYTRPPLRFVHPIVRSAVYAQVGILRRYQGHSKAARLLAGIVADPERIAAHLIRVPAISEPWAVSTLRAAARQAIARGASDVAVGYLRRCLLESMERAVRLEVLLEFGVAARQVNLAEAAEHLRLALHLSDEAYQRAHIAELLSQALIFLMRAPEAVSVLDDAAAALPTDEVGVRRRLDASIAQIPLDALDQQELTSRLTELRALEPDDSVGGRALDCVLSLHETYLGDRSGTDRAARGLAGGLLVERANSEVALLDGWLALMAGDRIDEAMSSIDDAIARGHRHGSLTSLALAYGCRSLGWMFKGQLAEAESSAQESVHLMTITGADLTRPFAVSVLADALIEQGRLDEANAVLGDVNFPKRLPESGSYGWLLETRARALRTQGMVKGALKDAMASGRRFAPHGENSSPLVGWRSEVALCLHALTRIDEAREHASEDLRLARQWGAVRPLGRALRVAGLIEGGSRGVALLEEAASILEDSPARLEYAKALIDLGAALRRTNQRLAARPLLTRGYDLARLCKAGLAASLAGAELRAAGGRSRHSRLTGLAALTPSEQRVAQLAAGGATNREIAQSLFVTPKTVEVHLSSTYRKLEINSRRDLSQIIS